jgi:FkbM family methyltransferase
MDKPSGADGVHELYPADIATLSRAELERVILGRTQVVYLGEGVALARVLTRYKMLLHTADRGFGCHVMMDGFWEIWLTQFFARTLKPGMRTIDVGANYGYYTMLLSDIVTNSGRVLAIEPNPAAAALLRESVLLNGFAAQAEVIEAALGAEDGEARLIVPCAEPKNAYLGHEARAGAVAHTVALRRLDTLAERLGSVDLVKIDAEGAEIAIIAGMSGLLRHQPPGLVLEFNAARYADAAGFLRSLLDVYGEVSFIDFDGLAKKVPPETVLTTQFGEDWLLYFSRPGN